LASPDKLAKRDFRGIGFQMSVGGFSDFRGNSSLAG